MQLTSFVQMIRLFVTNFVLLRVTPRLGPPVGGLLVTSRVRVRRLFLGLYSFYPSFGNELASCLLALLEALIIEFPQTPLVVELNGASCHHRRWRSVVVEIDGVSWSLARLPVVSFIFAVEGAGVPRGIGSCVLPVATT